ncbi:sulfatase [Agaribacter flavus]|uniref:Sulfatase n=1 Tax=Agaribacter flavus TaxID=1902781 RepID=A0ABV7FRP6_9ALTE
MKIKSSVVVLNLIINALFISLSEANQTSLSTYQTKPNIVLFFVDDLGWSDLGYRNNTFDTPNIDKLAQQGMDFTSAYIPTPTCSPSRSALLTGKHPARLKMTRHIPNSPKFGFDIYGRSDEPSHLWPTDPAKFPSVNWLKLDYLTYAEVLQKHGYYNHFIGKWHLGDERYHPVKQGFHSQYGTSNWGHPKSYYSPFFKHSEVLADKKDHYLTEVLTDNAVEFIEQYKDKQPFLLNLWYYTVHGPFVGKQAYLQHYLDKGLDPPYANYAAMVKSMDDSVGRVRHALQAQNMDKNTIIIFLSDQGGAFVNKPFHGGKKYDTLYEGGGRVPFIVYWPEHMKKGVKNDSPVQSLDLFPTILDIVGEPKAANNTLDGVSLIDVLKENRQLVRKTPLFGYRAYEDLYLSVREGNWKLLAYRSGEKRLFNLANDIQESINLASKYPDIVENLVKKAKVWEKEMGVEAYSGLDK